RSANGGGRKLSRRDEAAGSRSASAGRGAQGGTGRGLTGHGSRFLPLRLPRSLPVSCETAPRTMRQVTARTANGKHDAYQGGRILFQQGRGLNAEHCTSLQFFHGIVS